MDLQGRTFYYCYFYLKRKKITWATLVAHTSSQRSDKAVPINTDKNQFSALSVAYVPSREIRAKGSISLGNIFSDLVCEQGSNAMQ